MRSRRPSIATAAATIAVVALSAAGCGGNSGSRAGVASLNTSTTRTAPSPQNQQTAAVAFTNCMRTHGVTAFPDPPPDGADGHAFKDTIAHIASTNPHFQAAQQACNHLLPNDNPSAQNAAQQRAQLADELSFAHCMRRRGVARFPDPTAQGELSVAMVAAQGINVNSPHLLHIVQACLPASHGGLTPAKVRQALNNYNHRGH